MVLPLFGDEADFAAVRVTVRRATRRRAGDVIAIVVVLLLLDRLEGLLFPLPLCVDYLAPEVESVEQFFPMTLAIHEQVICVKVERG